MKTFVLFIAAIITLNTVNAQYTQNFEGNETILTGNCWSLTGVFHTSDPQEVITGNGSLYTNPPTNSSSTRDIVSPALNVTNTNFIVSFNYKLSSKLTGNAIRTIEVGVLNGSYTFLYKITLDKFTPETVLNFNQAFTLASTGTKKLVIKLGGEGGDGNSRLIFDDLYCNASPLYGAGVCNSAPIAVNDVFSGPVGSVITGNVMSNDNDPNAEPMTAAVVLTSADGVLVLQSNGNFTFTPSPSFIGTQTTFTYQLTDAGFDPMVSNIATVTISFFSGNPLPIKLINFDAKYNNPEVVLNWSTAQEKNFSHFVIERSADGVNFNQLGVVFGAGESDSKTNYSYSDKNLQGRTGLVYYRLKSVDKDAKTSFSAVRIIRLENEKAVISISTYPNPATNEVRVTIPANWQNKKVVYELFSANGQAAKKFETASSSQTEALNISSLNSGMYIVKVSCAGETAFQKIVKH